MSQQFTSTSAAAEVSRIHEADFGAPSIQRSVVYLRRASWGAIFAGAVLAIATQVLLTLLGTGIGLLALGARPENQPTTTGISIAAAIWWVISGIISLWFGGMVAGRLSGVAHPMDGALHGLVVWGLSSVVSLWALASSTAWAANAGLSTFNQYMSTPEGRSSMTQPGSPLESITGSRQGNAPGTQAPATRPLQGQGDQPAGPVDPQAREAASDLGKAAFWSFFSMILGAVAAGFGGSMGRRMGDHADRSELHRHNRPLVTPSHSPAPDAPRPRST